MADINEQLLEMQNNYNQQIFQREDTAIQRRVADLKQAGLSPILAANGYGASAGGQSQSPTQALNIALDYIVGQGMNEASIANAMANQAQASASMANANIRSQELAVQKEYNERYLDMMSAYYVAMIQNLNKQGENYSAQAGKTNKESDILGYNFDFYKGMALPTTAGITLSPLKDLPKVYDKNATATYLATVLADPSKNGVNNLANTLGDALDETKKHNKVVDWFFDTLGKLKEGKNQLTGWK